MKIYKRVLSFMTAFVLLLGFVVSVTGCSTLKEFFSNESKTDSRTAGGMAADGTITNAEWLAMVNDAFGMQDEQAPEDDIEKAKQWGVIGQDEEVNMDAPLDNQFATKTLMRATGFVDTSASDQEVIQSAIEKGVIAQNADLTNPQSAIEALGNASEAWSKQTFDYNENNSYAEGVQDFREQISADNVKINGSGSSVIMPSEYAQRLRTDSVFILPPDEEYTEGRAMKALSVADNRDGTSTVSSVPAQLNELYSKIDFSGGFTPNYDNIEILNDNANVTIGDSATGMSAGQDDTACIQPLSLTDDDGGIAQMAELTIPTVSIECPIPLKSSKEGGSSRKKEIVVSAKFSDIKLNTDVDIDFGLFSGVDVNRVYMALDYKKTIGVKYSSTAEESQNFEDAYKGLNGEAAEAEVQVAKIPFQICPGLNISFTASFVVSANGYISVELSADHTKGFEFKNGQLRRINECSNKDWAAKISGSVGLYFSFAISLDVAFVKESIVKLDLRVGPKLEARATIRDDMLCADVDFFLSITLSLKFHKLINKVLGEPKIQWTFADVKNSPMKGNFHAEFVYKDGKISVVDKCTHGQEETTAATTTVTSVPDGKLELDMSYLSLNQGETKKITIKSKPSGSEIKWSSNHPEIVSVDSNGNITAVGSGSAVITAKTADGKQFENCAVNVRMGSGYQKTSENRNIQYIGKLMAA